MIWCATKTKIETISKQGQIESFVLHSYSLGKYKNCFDMEWDSGDPILGGLPRSEKSWSWNSDSFWLKIVVVEPEIGFRNSHFWNPKTAQVVFFRLRRLYKNVFFLSKVIPRVPPLHAIFYEIHQIMKKNRNLFCGWCADARLTFKFELPNRTEAKQWQASRTLKIKTLCFPEPV